MKIGIKELKKIIKEEISLVLKEAPFYHMDDNTSVDNTSVEDLKQNMQEWAENNQFAIVDVRRQENKVFFKLKINIIPEEIRNFLINKGYSDRTEVSDLTDENEVEIQLVNK